MGEIEDTTNYAEKCRDRFNSVRALMYGAAEEGVVEVYPEGYRAGILQVTADAKCRAIAALPPEHRHVAIRPGLNPGTEDWLVEGPMMPVVKPGGRPMPIDIVFEVTYPPGQPVVLQGMIGPNNLQRYKVGEWPDLASFQAYWRSLG